MELIFVPLNEIIEDDRARVDYGEVGDLSESIKSKGLMQPLVIDSSKKLIAGGRRLRALKILRWETAPCRLYSSLSELQRTELELEENIKRKSLTWQEEIKLTEKMVRLKREQDPSLTIKNDLSGDELSAKTLQRNLFLSKMSELHPEILKEKDKANAMRKAERIQESKIRKLLVQASGGQSIMNTSQDGENSIPSFTLNGVTLYNQDCLQGLKNLPNESIDLLITDFPFGVKLDKNADFNKSWDQVYEDDTQDLLTQLLPELAKEFYRVLKEGAHFYIFYPSIFHHQFDTELRKYFKLQHVPLIWNKRTGGTSFAPYRVYTPNYEPILYGWKGEAHKLKAPGYCVLNFDNLNGGEKSHPAEKPLELLCYLIDQSSIEGETVLETFSGSGVTLEACVRMNRKGIGFELSPRWYELGVERLMNRGKS